MKIITSYTDRSRRGLINTVINDCGVKPSSNTMVDIEKLAPTLSGAGIIFIEYERRYHHRIEELTAKIHKARTSKYHWIVILDKSNLTNQNCIDYSTSIHADGYVANLISKAVIDSILSTAKQSRFNFLAELEYIDLASDCKKTITQQILSRKKSLSELLHQLESIDLHYYYQAVAAIVSDGRGGKLSAYHLVSLLKQLSADKHGSMIDTIATLLIRNSRYKKETFQAKFNLALQNKNKTDALKNLSDLQSVLSEDSQLFTKLALHSVKAKDKTTLVKAVNRHLAHQSEGSLDEFTLSLLLVTLESRSHYVWLRKIVGPLLAKNRRLPYTARAHFSAYLMLIDAIGLAQCNKHISANVQFEIMLRTHKALYSQSSSNETLWVLSMIYYCIAGKWSRVRESIGNDIPPNLNPRIKAHLLYQVESLHRDIKIIQDSIDSSSKAKRALLVAKKRKASNEILAQISKNLANEYTQTNAYIKLLNSVEKVQSTTKHAATNLRIELSDNQTVQFDAKSEITKLTGLKDSANQHVEESWFARTMRTIRKKTA